MIMPNTPLHLANSYPTSPGPACLRGLPSRFFSGRPDSKTFFTPLRKRSSFFPSCISLLSLLLLLLTSSFSPGDCPRQGGSTFFTSGHIVFVLPSAFLDFPLSRAGGPLFFLRKRSLKTFRPQGSSRRSFLPFPNSFFLPGKKGRCNSFWESGTWGSCSSFRSAPPVFDRIRGSQTPSPRRGGR